MASATPPFPSTSGTPTLVPDLNIAYTVAGEDDTFYKQTIKDLIQQTAAFKAAEVNQKLNAAKVSIAGPLQPSKQ